MNSVAGGGGGSLRNAIPREAFVTVALPAENQDKLAELFNYYAELLKTELGKIETDIVTFNEEVATDAQVFAIADQQRFIAALNACPNGVMRMSDEVEGVVETSLNVGVITTEENKVTVLCLIRSLIDSGRSQVEGMLQSVAELAGAQIEFSGAYPGWKPDADSEIMAIFRDMYEGISTVTSQTSWLSTQVLNVVCSKNLTRTWIWFLSVQPSSSLILQMRK